MKSKTVAAWFAIFFGVILANKRDRRFIAIVAVGLVTLFSSSPSFAVPPFLTLSSLPFGSNFTELKEKIASQKATVDFMKYRDGSRWVGDGWIFMPGGVADFFDELRDLPEELVFRARVESQGSTFDLVFLRDTPVKRRSGKLMLVMREYPDGNDNCDLFDAAKKEIGKRSQGATKTEGMHQRDEFNPLLTSSFAIWRTPKRRVLLWGGEGGVEGKPICDQVKVFVTDEGIWSEFLRREKKMEEKNQKVRSDHAKKMLRDL